MTQPEGAAPSPIVGPAAQDVGRQLLADLQGRWIGSGINTIWVPSLQAAQVQNQQSMYEPIPGQPPVPLPLFVSSRTTETLVVETPLGSVPNKGAQEHFEELAAPYQQRSHDENGKLVHAESGYWLVTPATTQPSSAPRVAKLSAVPHGTTSIVQAPLPDRQAGQTLLSVAESTPVMPSPAPPGLTPPAGPLAADLLANVATYVGQRASADRTGVLWDLQFTSTGVINIDFLNVNAQVTSIVSHLWLGNLGIRSDGVGQQVASVLAYVQTVQMQFDGVSWPHISVGYLMRDMESIDLAAI